MACRCWHCWLPLEFVKFKGRAMFAACNVGGSRIAAMNLECQILNDKKHVKEFFENVCQKYLYSKYVPR